MFTQILNSQIFQIQILGNSVREWAVAAIIFSAVLIGLKIFKAIVISRLKKLSKKTKTEIDDIVVNAIRAIHWPFYVLVSLYIALVYLKTHPLIDMGFDVLFMVGVVYYVIRAAEEFVDYGARSIIKKREKEENGDTGMIKILSSIIKIALWAVAVLMVLSNLGYNITSLIAGLGIGGIAVALALQNVLSDLFSAIAIYFDKPFKIGDFIILGTDMGIVKKIGIKTTRIQTLQGEELVVSNNELTQARIQNFGKMQRRRIVFEVGVAYETQKAKLEKIPEMVKEIIKKQKNTEVDRVHFKYFGDSSLNYEIVYYVNIGDYNVYMDIQQAINLGIVEAFEKEKIEIAYPTRTVYVRK